MPAHASTALLNVPLANYTLSADQVAVVINDAQPESVVIGAYYQTARHIPDRNMVHVRLAGAPHKLTEAAFNHLKQTIESQLGPDVQAMVMVWTAPYAVECNSITSAMTMGYDLGLCAHLCSPSKANPYFNSPSAQPYTDFKMRLSMLLPTDSVAEAKALIDRGVLSSFKVTASSAYQLTTEDQARSVRSRFFLKDGVFPRNKLTIKNERRNFLDGEQDVMFYLTGFPIVPKLETIRFLPGALADHMTSYGGDLLGGGGQMSSLEWLRAGATASYGSVTEPCNFWQKFPNPQVLMLNYVAGASAIEAYWKSVAWPTQGVFIGEPLAAPYRRKSR